MGEARTISISARGVLHNEPVLKGNVYPVGPIRASSIRHMQIMICFSAFPSEAFEVNCAKHTSYHLPRNAGTSGWSLQLDVL